MKKIAIIFVAIAVLLIAMMYKIQVAGGVDPESKNAEVVEETKPIISHQQDIWISVLEWCESRGKLDAVNPKDRDNTPSYYSFQWKPTTFRYYAEKYGLIEKGKSIEEIMVIMKNYKLQRTIVEFMVNDKSVRWSNEFPDCVKKYGVPPKL